MKKAWKIPVAFLGLGVLWELICLTGWFSEALFPSPIKALTALWGLIANGSLFLNIGASMYRFLIGYLSASVAAIVLGLILGWFMSAWEFANPIVQFLRPISPVAWLPFIVLWFGIGDTPAIVIIFIAAFFPTLLSTVSAVARMDPVYLKVASNFGVPQHKVITNIVFPVVFPQIISGLRLAIGTAWIFLVVGEMVGAQSGLGYMIVDARNNVRLDTLMATIIAIGIIGLILDSLVRYLESVVSSRWGFGSTGGRK